MTLLPDNDSAPTTASSPSALPPLRPKAAPAIPIEALLAVNDVTLAAADIPRGILRQFYTQLLGLTFLDADLEILRVTHNQRTISLSRGHPEPGHLGLLISARHFGDVLLRLRDKSLHYELLHADSGLTRVALFRDPAGNWIHLQETRPF